MKRSKKYHLIPAMLFLTLIITSCSAYERIADSKDPAVQHTKEESASRETTTSPEGDKSVSDADIDIINGETNTETSQENASGYSPDFSLNEQGQAICGNYFKSGDYTYQLTISPGDPDTRGILKLGFLQRDKERSNSFERIHEFELPYENGVNSYSLEDVNYNSTGSVYPIILNKDGSITLQSKTEAAGDYYTCEGNLIMPEALTRPLNHTDLIGLNKDEMQLLRNQFYAVYGRTFKTEKLKTYFETEPWYRGRIASDQFNERTFSGLEKRNIAFLKEAEENFDSGKAQVHKAAYDALAPAPYLELLPKQGEILVDMYSDFEHTADRGIYYEAEGTIYVPVTITVKEQKAINAGDRVEVVTDELTGAKSILKKSDNLDYGAYELLDIPGNNGSSGRYVMAAYDHDIGTYRLWADSDDTVFKRVYEGSIYVLKGACEEYYYYFDLPLSEREEMAGSYRVMDFNDISPYGPYDYGGNVLITDPKGYIKALYFRGD